ncbi:MULTISPECIES: hypothetical protein [unclassified Halomonas]|uniref:hypothetical protein n=1 Tax=unclassified Halomonas TaxID=2609666 RepID=UPI001C94D929|nr:MULTISPECIES: hypothetical protein [unclassified Halomonas]MBY5927201.1 hypothetical protein [Halomonas sp. DP4Y7-2]MBY6234243.1 hypothetical protein [Halomonas sp. DP4Y7-1]
MTASRNDTASGGQPSTKAFPAQGDRDEMAEELARLKDRHRKLRDRVTSIRHYAGDHLPAKPGLVIVKMLEDALKV